MKRNIKVVSFSGGKTSARMCQRMIEKFGRKNVAFVYMDTGLEHPKTYEFIKNVNKAFDLKLVCLRADFSKPLNSRTAYTIVDVESLKTDFSIFRGMLAKYGVPYIGGMYCTSRLKTRPFKAYCKKTYGDNYEVWLGIRADEPARLIGANNYSAAKKELGCTPEMALDMYRDYKAQGAAGLGSHFDLEDEHEKKVFTDIHKHLDQQTIDRKHHLADICDDEKSDINRFWQKMLFDLGIPDWLGNCMFCPKKSDLKLVAASMDEEEYYNTYVEMIKSEHVRIDGIEGRESKMYRGKQSIVKLIARFDGNTGEEIKQRIKGEHRNDTGSCSESCELL